GVEGIEALAGHGGVPRVDPGEPLPVGRGGRVRDRPLTRRREAVAVVGRGGEALLDRQALLVTEQQRAVVEVDVLLAVTAAEVLAGRPVACRAGRVEEEPEAVAAVRRAAEQAGLRPRGQRAVGEDAVRADLAELGARQSALERRLRLAAELVSRDERARRGVE